MSERPETATATAKATAQQTTSMNGEGGGAEGWSLGISAPGKY